MNILAFAHGLKLGGAQVSTLEFFELLRNEVKLRAVVGENAEKKFLRQLQRLNIEYRLVPCSTTSGIPDMDISLIKDWLKWSDIAWITDELLIAPRIKKIRNIQVIAHLHSYPLICPWWGLLYGMREVCYRGCSILRIVRCKQFFNKELARLGLIKAVKSNFYQMLDLAKGPLDYSKWRRVVNKEVINSIDGFIAVSNFVKRIHEELLPIKDKPVEVIYNPITFPLKYAQDSETSENRESNLIIYASGSNPVKGPHIILKALKLLLNENLNVKLIMFNCKDAWVDKYAQRLGVKKFVIFTKKVPFNELYGKISMANVVVMSSLVPESFGRVSVEANRLGVVAVVTDRGGLPETIVNGETGYVAKAHPEDIAKSISRALNMTNGNIIKRKSLRLINPQTSISKLLNFFDKF